MAGAGVLCWRRPPRRLCVSKRLGKRVRDHVREAIPSPAVAIGRIPLETAAGAVQAVVLVLGDPALVQESVEDRQQVLWRRGRTTRDRLLVRV